MTYAELPCGPPKSLVRSDSTVPVHFAHISHNGGQFDDPAVPDMALILGLSTDMPFKSDFGDGWRETRYRSGDMFIVPANTAISVDCGGACSALHAVMPAAPIADALEEDGLNPDSALGPLYGPVFHDDAIRAAILQMWLQTLRHGPLDPLLHDALMQTFLGSLLTKAKARSVTLSNRLTPKEVERVMDYCMQHLDHGVRVAELGELVGMSEAHFTRSFRRSTGHSPYQFVLRLRLSRACSLLQDRNLSLAEVAYACGFSSQSHLTDLFRVRVGVSPAQYRSELLEA